MQHEALVRFAFQHIQPLLVFGGAQGGRHQGLRLAAREQRRAVGAGQQAYFTTDGTDLVKGPPVRPLALQQGVLAEDALLQPSEGSGRFAARFLVGLGITRNQRFLQRGNLLLAFQLGIL